MSPRTLLPALCLLLLCACSTTPPSAPAKIDPPPVGLTAECVRPADLGPLATAQDLATWAVEWIGAYGCERGKRVALIAAWPR